MTEVSWSAEARQLQAAYRDRSAAALTDPDAFWLEQAQRIQWFEAPTQGRSVDADGIECWFADGQLNTAWLALDHQVQSGRGEQTALIYDSPASGTTAQYTFAELLDWTANVAGSLQALGVERGDRVIIYMPMVPETAVAMLACARIGAVHSVVFGGFAAPELALRIDDAAPKVVLSASCGIEFDRVIEYKPLLDAALLQANHPVEPLCGVATSPGNGCAGGAARPGLARFRGAGWTGGCRPGGGDGSALHPLHIGNDG